MRIAGQYTCGNKVPGDKRDRLAICGRPAVGYTVDLGNGNRIYLCGKHAGDGLWIPAVTFFKDKEL